MTDLKTIDISHVKFELTVFPTDADMKLWDSLTPEQQRAVILRDLAEAERSGIAENASKEDIIAEVQREMSNGL